VMRVLMVPLPDGQRTRLSTPGAPTSLTGQIDAADVG
jgi:hypothetical protein